MQPGIFRRQDIQERHGYEQNEADDPEGQASATLGIRYSITHLVLCSPLGTGTAADG
jgi:hypothetical protein